MLNNEKNIAMENGYVVLPVEKYNELLRAAMEAEMIFKLRVKYDHQVEVEYDDQAIYDAARRRYENSAFNTPERELIDVTDFRVYTSTLTKEVPQPSDDEEPTTEE